MAQRTPNDVRALLCQGEFPGHTSNAISAKKLSMIAHQNGSVRARSSRNFLHDNRNVDGNGVHNLNQGIGDINVGAESLAGHHSGSVDRIGTRGFEGSDASVWTRDRDSRRVRHYLGDPQPGSECAGYTGPDLNRPGGARVERQLELTGYHLHD